MKKIKRWLIERILPVWARAALESENRRLEQENSRLKEKIAQLEAYAEGLQWGVRTQRRIVINAGEAVKK